MRREARRLFHPAQASIGSIASLRRVFRACIVLSMGLCIYNICNYMGSRVDGFTAHRYGVANPGQIARLTGKEILQAIIEGRLPHPPISETLTFWLVEIGDGFAAFEGERGDHLLNPMGTAHGGWAMTLIDSAAGCAGFSVLPAGAAFRTIETKVNLSRPITSDTGRVRAEAHVVSQTRQIISTEARVTSPDGRVLAHGTSTLMVVSGAK